MYSDYVHMRSQPSLLWQIASFLVLLSLASLFFVCVAGPFMAMGDMDQRTDCGMNYDMALCPMTLSGRLGFWQHIIVPVSSSFEALALLAFLAALAFGWSRVAIIKAPQSKLNTAHAVDPPSLFDYLRQQFSQGILHPKLY